MVVLQGLRNVGCTKAVGQRTVSSLLVSRTVTKRPTVGHRSFVTTLRRYSEVKLPGEPLSTEQTPTESASTNPIVGSSFMDDWTFKADVLNPVSTYALQRQSHIKARNSPEDAWRARSDDIAAKMRKTLVDTGGIPRLPLLGPKRQRHVVGYDITISGAQVPNVSTGRTITAPTFQTAILRLGSILQKNRVKQEWRRDMRHEKGDVKRYRLRSERHRRRFGAMVRRKVQIVQAIRRRGM